MDNQTTHATLDNVIRSISVIVDGQEKVITVVESLLNEARTLFPDNKNLIILGSRVDYLSEKLEKLSAECTACREKIARKIDDAEDALQNSNREHLTIKDSVMDKVAVQQRDYETRLRVLESTASNLDKQIAVMALRVGAITAFVTSLITGLAVHLVTKG